MSNGDHDQGDEQPRPGSQLDQRCDSAGRERSMLAFRTVVAVLLRELGDFLYTLKAGPAGDRLRRPSSRRLRHDSHRGAGLTLHIRRYESPPSVRSDQYVLPGHRIA
jgi:hypothetical protein